MSDRVKPWFQHKEALFNVALFLGALSLYAFDWFYSLSNGSFGLRGGVSTVGAERVLGGEIPYRDFWTMYAPGHFYLLALLFRMFGTYLLVERIAAAVVCAAATWLCYRLVLKLEVGRIAALISAAIFLAVTYNTGYFKTLGSYPPAIFLVFTTLNLMVLHYKTDELRYLIAAGLATGALFIFKHDVGGYTAIAVVAGLMVYYWLAPAVTPNRVRSLLTKVVVYSAGTVVIGLPVLIYFVILAGPDMLQDLIIFPLTDFRFARPEGYPSILPFDLIAALPDLYAESRLMMLYRVFYYVTFAIPFGLFLLGLVATGLAVVRRQSLYAALGLTFSVGYLLHYIAAHVQINTHIITMSAYSFWLGVIFYKLIGRKFTVGRSLLTRLVLLMLALGWFISLAAQPAYMAWQNQRQKTAELNLSKVSGFKVSPEEASVLTELATFIDTHVPEGQKLFVGLHRHDVIVIGDILIYFVLDRPNATRYQELHPAVADTTPIQREIIADLQDQDVSVIVLKHIFPDKTLERVKKNFLKNMPYIGATDLDEFIREHYVEVQEFGPYEVWQRTE